MWYFKGRRKKYKSPYTGKEVDAAVKKAEDTTSTAAEIDAAVNFEKALTVTASEINSGVEKGNMLPSNPDFPYRALISNEDVDGYIQQEKLVITAIADDSHLITDCTWQTISDYILKNAIIQIQFDDNVISLNEFAYIPYDYEVGLFIPNSIFINIKNFSDVKFYSVSFKGNSPDSPLVIYMKEVYYADTNYIGNSGFLYGPKLDISANDYTALIGGTTITLIKPDTYEPSCEYINVAIYDNSDEQIAYARAYLTRRIINNNTTLYQYLDYGSQLCFDIAVSDSNSNVTVTPNPMV